MGVTPLQSVVMNPFCHAPLFLCGFLIFFFLLSLISSDDMISMIPSTPSQDLLRYPTLKQSFSPRHSIWLPGTSEIIPTFCTYSGTYMQTHRDTVHTHKLTTTVIHTWLIVLSTPPILYKWKNNVLQQRPMICQTKHSHVMSLSRPLHNFPSGSVMTVHYSTHKEAKDRVFLFLKETMERQNEEKERFCFCFFF